VFFVSPNFDYDALMHRTHTGRPCHKPSKL